MRPNAASRINRLVLYLVAYSGLLLSTFTAGIGRAEVIGSVDDLWDVNNGTVVTATSGVRPGFDAADMFGGENSPMVPGETIFDDDRPLGYVHYIEWQTPTPVRIGQIDLYARGDSPLYLNEREFDRFVLRARSAGSETYDLVILDITPSHPFDLLDETSGLFLRTNVLAFVSQDFRAEITQFTAGRGYDGPRIMELDAFEPVPVVPSAGDLWDINSGVSIVQASGMWGGFDAADMFGASNSWSEPGSSVFADGQPPGFVHSVEWRTPTLVEVQKVNVFAAGDGEIYMHEREFDRFVLKAKSPGAADYDVVLIDYTPTHPYNFLESETFFLLSVEVAPITAQDFRAEFLQFDAGRGYDGPRIIELDAFGLACNPPPGITAWWPGEGDGGDVAGVNHGELVNGLGFAEGLVGQAFEFTANGQHVFIPASEELAVGSLTIEGWIKPASVDVDMPVVEYAPENGGVGVQLWISVHPEGYQSLPGSLFANVISADGVNHIIATEGGIVQPGVWSHVALNYDMMSGLSRLFHNGTQVAEQPIGSFLPKTSLPVLIGHRTPGNAGTFDGFTFAGQMDEVSIYSRALSLAEIEAIYAAGNKGKCLPVKPCATPPTGLLAWWPGEGDGTDIVGGHDGELLSGVGLGDGLVGQAMVFDGVDDHVRIPISESLTSATFSMEAWIKPLGPVMDPQWNQDFVFGQALGSPWLIVRPGAGGVRPVFGYFVNPFLFPEVESSVELPMDEFSHVACTWDGIGLRIYVNGVLAGESFPSEAPVPSTCDFYVGGHLGSCAGYDFDGGYFHGAVDELSLYGRALSAAEIAAIHAAGSAGKCLPPVCVSTPAGLLAWWPGESDGADVAGGHDGDLVNGLTFADGVVGQAMVFDGVDDHVRIPFAESLTSATFSMEAWIKPLGPVMDPQWNQDFVFGQALGSPWLIVRPGAGGVRPVFGYFVHPFLYPEVESSVELSFDEFSHVACTWDGIGLRIYVNGVLAGESFPSVALVPSACDFYVGGHLGSCAGYDFDGGYFHGSVDELSLYVRALSAAEIAAIHDAGSAGKCPPQGYTLTVGTTPGGTVLRVPEAAAYEPGDEVKLTAQPEAGFAFDHWQGDVSGTEPEVTLVMDGPKQVMAVFVDVTPPEIAIVSPLAGVTESSAFVLSGSVTDNLGVNFATWEWNGQSLGLLPLNGGQFYVDGLQWILGENRIRIVAVDIAGHEASTEVVVEWVPARLLSVVDPDPRQEGQRVQVTIQLSSSGDVGGASFVLRYNPTYLKQPSLDWSPSVQSALNQVNTDIPGEVRATFALPATAVPSGTRNLAVVTFRARSVPETLTTGLQLRLVDVSDPSGNSIASGSAVKSGLATILVRRVVGDNNANHRLDVGDATLMQRLLTGLDPVRFWDRSGNDVNQNTELDSGDVIRVLRAVVRLDPQPLPTGPASADISLARANVAPMSEETAGAMLLEADALRAAPGELVTVRVRLGEVLSPIAAMALNLEYPVEALRLLNPQSHRVGEVVPATAVALWNVAPAQNDYALQSGAVSLAVSSALSWPASEGAVAEFTFQVQEGQTGRYQWPIRVSQGEISADGYDMAALADATLYFVGRDPLPPQLAPGSAGLGEEGFGFSFPGEAGVEYIIEVSSDLQEWISLGTRVGANEPITILDPAALGAEYRFYRVRFE